MELIEIGRIKTEGEEMFLEINKEYKSGLKGLDGFSNINVFWWFDKCDNEKSRNKFEIKKPYRKAPEVLGVFSTRSPERPNPIALSITDITHIDYDNGRVYISYIDAMNDSIILDLKPYTPSIERVQNVEVPQWCNHWPKSYEESGNFDWEHEFI